ncbi:MAG: Transcriptional regulator, AraC family, partial [uncultured Solirubrobacteraceae bacterium]
APAGAARAAPARGDAREARPAARRLVARLAAGRAPRRCAQAPGDLRVRRRARRS